MLVNLTPIKEEQDRRRIIAKENNFEYIPQDDKSLIQETGIYQCSFAFNFSEFEFEETQKLSWDDRYKIFEGYEKSTYGIADNINQIKEYYKDEVQDLNKKYAICVSPVWQERENKGKTGGWRWHKWGEYIGKLNPQCEYLDDEEFGDDFQYVLIFTIYAINNKHMNKEEKEKKMRGLIKILELNKKKGFNEAKTDDTIHQIELAILRLHTKGV